MSQTDLREDVSAAVNDMRDTRALRREFRELPNRVPEPERIEVAAKASAPGAFIGVLSLTGSRVVFLSHGPIRKKFEDYELQRIDTVSWSEGAWVGCKLALGVNGREIVFEGLDKQDGRRLAEAIRARVS